MNSILYCTSGFSLVPEPVGATSSFPNVGNLNPPPSPFGQETKQKVPKLVQGLQFLWPNMTLKDKLSRLFIYEYIDDDDDDC